LHILPLVIPYPRIDPVAVSIGPFSIRWYALAYVAGLLFAWWYVRRLAAGRPADRRILEPADVDDLLFWATLGVILGGRIGYVLFYKPSYFLAHPLEIPALWTGGMSFHGGLIGVILAIVIFARVRKRRLLSVADLAACATPVGLFFGRIANFINDELWGRVSHVPWAMVFPTGGPLPRHPSQLYEALLEGVALFVLLWVIRRRTNALDRPGTLAGWFCIGYGVARFIAEYFRQPDAFLPNDGFLFGFITMGQILSLPVIAFGIFLVWRARRRARAETAVARM
jgi:phosphatidylglycerol:prolipoprotein diacylglycerol transferase